MAVGGSILYGYRSRNRYQLVQSHLKWSYKFYRTLPALCKSQKLPSQNVRYGHFQIPSLRSNQPVAQRLEEVDRPLTVVDNPESECWGRCPSEHEEPAPTHFAFSCGACSGNRPKIIAAVFATQFIILIPAVLIINIWQLFQPPMN